MSLDRLAPRDLLTGDELAEVRARSDLKGLWLVAHAWGVIAAAIAAVAIWPNPLTFLLAVVVIGSRQLGLAVLGHDAAHGVLTRSARLNEFLGVWLLSAPVASDLHAYRAYHLKHHARTQQPDDPDLPLSAPFPITPSSFRRKMLRDITGQTGFKQRGAQFRGALGRADWPAGRRIGHFGRKLGKPLLANAALFALCAAAGVWWAWPLLWLLPLLTWYQVVVRVRNIAEHAIVPDNDDPMRNARTTKANLIERAILAPYFVNYHVEHHLFMWVPCYNLPRLHAILMAKGHGPRMEIQPSYRTVLTRAISRPEGPAPQPA